MAARASLRPALAPYFYGVVLYTLKAAHRLRGCCLCPGLVSMLPTVDGRLFKIEGGNMLLPQVSHAAQ